MINSHSGQKLSEFYAFFLRTDSTRLDGLHASYFAGFNQDEKEEAWNFLLGGFPTSAERIQGLWLLDRQRAMDLFTQALAQESQTSSIASERKQIQGCRLLMLGYMCSAEPKPEYLSEMSTFARSEFPDVRAQFARSLPTEGLTPSALDALKGMIYTETETRPRTAAVTNFLLIHGIKFQLKDPVYNDLYLALRSNNIDEKSAAISRVESGSIARPS